MHIFGTNIFSQHLYTALLASLTGLLICINFSQLPQWLLSLGLVLIYCQQHLVNPTPNPGHLFELFLLTIFTLVNKGKKHSRRSIFFGSFVLMGVAFLSKQYAIFVLLGYAISQFENVNWRISDRKKYTILLCVGTGAASSYYFLLIPNGPLKLQASVSLLAMVLPFVLLIWANFRVRASPESQVFSDASRNLVVGVTIFIFTITIGFAVLYQSLQLPHIFYQVLIEAPRKINNNTVLLSFSPESLVSIGAFLFFAICTVYLIITQYSDQTSKTKLYVYQFSAIFIGVVAFTKIGNLSASLFLILFPVTIIWVYLMKLDAMPPNRKQFFYVMTCYQFILIPYPNVNFHIMIFVIAFFILITDKYGIVKPRKMVHLWAFPIVLVSLLLAHEVSTINSMKVYSFKEVQFKSGSTSWDLSIADSQNSNGNLNACSTIGCKMLLLISKA
jgi:hypothetical protein